MFPRFNIHIHLGPHHNQVPNYPIGAMVGVKSKCCNQFGRDTFWFCRGSDIVFEYMKFMRSSRGTFRCGISNVRISNVLIQKDGPNWCLGILCFRFFYFKIEILIEILFLTEILLF